MSHQPTASYGYNGSLPNHSNAVHSSPNMMPSTSILPGFHGPSGQPFVPMVDPNAKNPLYSPLMKSSNNNKYGGAPKGTSSSSSSSSSRVQVNERGGVVSVEKKKKGCCAKKDKPPKEKKTKGCCAKKDKPPKEKKTKGCCAKKDKKNDDSLSDNSQFSWKGSAEANEFGGQKKKCCGCGPRTPNRKDPTSNFGTGGETRKTSANCQYEYCPTAEVTKKKKCC
eukprot:GHVH01007454.1.p1 GENE.GHVH01007454.1~~GHVH01007454.1.p1  ORF type:complete len:223 (+),score=41.15 GHVH01007454.1:357-1025(+)